MELDLHSLGYQYVGPASLYKLTWFELFSIIDASRKRTDSKSGVRKGDVDRFDKFNKALKDKADVDV